MGKDWIGLRYLPVLIGIIVIYGLGNILLHYGQEWYYRADKEELDSIKKRLTILKMK